MSTFFLKRNDTSPRLVYALRPLTVDLTGAAVRFHMRPVGQSTPKVNAAATVDQATGEPTVSYGWIAADTDTVGVYEAEFQVTYGDGTVETFPNAENLIVKITEDIV